MTLKATQEDAKRSAKPQMPSAGTPCTHRGQFMSRFWKHYHRARRALAFTKRSEINGS